MDQMQDRQTPKFTPRQIEVLRFCVDHKTGAWHMPTRRMGGAFSRLIDRLVQHDLLDSRPPYRITEAGRAALAKAGA